MFILGLKKNYTSLCKSNWILKNKAKAKEICCYSHHSQSIIFFREIPPCCLFISVSILFLTKMDTHGSVLQIFVYSSYFSRFPRHIVFPATPERVQTHRRNAPYKQGEILLHILYIRDYVHCTYVLS